MSYAILGKSRRTYFRPQEDTRTRPIHELLKNLPVSTLDANPTIRRKRASRC